MTFMLHIKFPNGKNQSYQFEKETVYLGRRDGNDVKLAFPFVSGRHCSIQYHEGHFFVQDLGATNGTMVNGQTLEPNVPQPVRPGDVVQIGALEIRLEPIQDATIIESVPDISAPADGIQTRPEMTTSRASVESSAGPSAMWQLQTGMFSFEQGSLQTMPPAGQPSSAPPGPRSVRDFEHSVVIRHSLPSARATKESEIPWGIIFQGVGLVLAVATLTLMIIILLV